MTTAILDSDTPSSSAKTVTKTTQRKDIQGLRAIAVIMVVIFHSGLPLPAGFIGVDIFFVISGYVITSMLYREYQKTHTISFKTFYARRFKRLTPALALTVSITIILALFLLPPLLPQKTTAETGAGAMLLIANFVIATTTGGYFDAKADMNPLLNTWSLSVEEQFYLIFPLILYFGWKVTQKFNRQKLSKYFPIILVSAFMILSFSLMIVGSRQQTQVSWLGFYSPFPRAWEFAVGSLLALYCANRQPNKKRLAGLIAATLGTFLLIIANVGISSATTFPSQWTLLPVIATALLIYAGQTSNPISALLSTQPFVKIGDWSYSIYLWHWPLIVFSLYIWPNYPLAPLFAAIISFIPALLSYYWLENPIRKLKNLTRQQKLILVCITITPPLLLAQTTLWVQQNVWKPKITSQAWTIHPGDTGQEDFYAYMTKHYYPCEEKTILQTSEKWENVTRCFQTKKDVPVTTVLIGDSHAESLMIGLGTALPEQNIAYYIIGIQPSATIGNPRFDNIYNIIKTSPTIKNIILTEYWIKKGTPTPQTLKALNDLTQLDKKVYIIQDIPDYAFDATVCKYRQAPLIARTQCTEPKEMYNEKNVYYPQLLTALKATPNITLIGTEKYFCTEKECSMTPTGELFYRDDHHLNIKGSQYLGEKIVESTPGLKQLQKN